MNIDKNKVEFVKILEKNPEPDPGFCKKQTPDPKLVCGKYFESLNVVTCTLYSTRILFHGRIT